MAFGTAGLTELGAVLLQMPFGWHDLKVASEQGAKSILQYVDQKRGECYKGSRKSESLDLISINVCSKDTASTNMKKLLKLSHFSPFSGILLITTPSVTFFFFFPFECCYSVQLYDPVFKTNAEGKRLSCTLRTTYLESHSFC